MARSTIAFGDAKAVKKWSPLLFQDTMTKSYWDKKFISKSRNTPIQRLTDLEVGAGDTISYDLSVQLRERPIYGDDIAKGKAEALRWYSDVVYIDQMRKPVSAGGKMSRKRTAHNLRTVAKDRLSDFWAKFNDEMIFIYLSGARGINEDFIELLTWAGHAGNAIQAPDTAHLMYGGDATAKANVDSSDVMTRAVIERAETRASMMRATDPTTQNMLPIEIEGGQHYVCIMSKYQEHSMRTAAGSDWLDIQKALTTAEGSKNAIFKGGSGMIKNVVLHSHANTIRFSDYGSGVNLPASRALFMGRQAGVVAYGSESGWRFTWVEETDDYGNHPTVAAGCIVGVKKTRFNSKDFGIQAIDTYALPVT